MNLIKFEKNKKEEDAIRLNTISNECGNYVVFACNIDGNKLPSGNIVLITPDGHLTRCPACNVQGIQVDDKGRILLDE